MKQEKCFFSLFLIGHLLQALLLCYTYPHLSNTTEIYTKQSE